MIWLLSRGVCVNSRLFDCFIFLYWYAYFCLFNGHSENIFQGDILLIQNSSVNSQHNYVSLEKLLL